MGACRPQTPCRGFWMEPSSDRMSRFGLRMFGVRFSSRVNELFDACCYAVESRETAKPLCRSLKFLSTKIGS